MQLVGNSADSDVDAEEGDWLELLVASERVHDWMAAMEQHRNDTKRLRQVVEELAQAVESNEAYCEEARRAGAVSFLTGLMKRIGDQDEDLLSFISTALAALSGPLAAGNRLRTLRYGSHNVTVKEGALGDGVGAKVWLSAHALCHELLAHPGVVAGRRVLEIGAGCGVCGLLAAQLGAREVVLTDYVDQLLLNLRDAMHANLAAASGKGAAPLAAADAGGEATASRGGGGRAQSVESLSAWVAGDRSDQDAASGDERVEGEQAAWAAGNVAVRFLDWSDAVAYLDQQRAGHAEEASAASGSSSGTARGLDGPSTRSIGPALPPSRRFDVILATEVLYEWPMAVWVPAALAHFLRPGGLALIYMAVRDQVMYEAMVGNMRGRGLRVGARAFQPHMGGGGLAGRKGDYEGGFKIVAAEHAAAPAEGWHRDDLFA